MSNKDNCKFSDNTAGGVYIMCADLVATISNSHLLEILDRVLVINLKMDPQ